MACCAALDAVGWSRSNEYTAGTYGWAQLVDETFAPTHAEVQHDGGRLPDAYVCFQLGDCFFRTSPESNGGETITLTVNGKEQDAMAPNKDGSIINIQVKSMENHVVLRDWTKLGRAGAITLIRAYHCETAGIPWEKRPPAEANWCVIL